MSDESQMAYASTTKKMMALKKDLIKRGLTHSTKTKGGWLTIVDDPDLLLQKFEQRWKKLPTHFCFLDRPGIYVILGPIPS